MMKRQMRPVAILGGQRTPFVKSFTSYARLTNQDLLSATLAALVSRFALKGEILGDVAAGAVITHSSDWNLTREAVLSSGLHPTTPGYNVQRACGTSLETINHIALKIAAGQIEAGIGAGTDTNSDIPVVYPREMGWKLLDLRAARGVADKLKAVAGFSLRDLRPILPGVIEPRTGLSMGQHTEKMVKEWHVSRREQDELTLRSHQSAVRAYKTGFYDDLLFPFHRVQRDSTPREDTTLEKLGKLKPAFDSSDKGTLTAGNSTPLTDGAAAVLLSSEDWAKARGHAIQAYLTDVEVAAVDFAPVDSASAEGLLMAPTKAVATLLARNQLRLQDFDFYEIHEAFAGQVLCTLRAWESTEYCRNKLGRNEALGSIDLDRMNIKGGSVAIGHPFAATGARIVATLAKILAEAGGGRGLISICTAGGMGVAAIVERPKT